MSNTQSAVLPLHTQPLDAVATRSACSSPTSRSGSCCGSPCRSVPPGCRRPTRAVSHARPQPGRGPRLPLDNQPHAYLPPGYPLLLAAFDRVGLGSMWCLNLMMGTIGLLTVWMSYRLVSEIASREVALLVAGLLGCNSLVHAMSAVQLSDVPFTLLVLTGLYGMLRGLRGQRRALEWGGLAILASCWIRVAGVALAVGCALAIVLQPRSTSAVRVVANAIASSWESPRRWASSTGVISSHFKPSTRCRRPVTWPP